MVAISSAVRISCALVVIVMSICSATTVAASESTSAGVALTTLHLPRAPAAIKRHLKRTTAMEASGTSEERALTFPTPGIDSFLSSLKSTSENTYRQSQRWIWWLTFKNADEVFQRLKLNEISSLDLEQQIKLFEHPRFMNWVTFVEEKYPEKPTEAIETMFDVLVLHYGEEARLGELVAAGKATNNEKLIKLAADLQAAQRRKWDKAHKTVKYVLKALKLNNKERNLLQDPLLLQLNAFARLRDPLSADISDELLTAFREFYTDDAAWAKLLFAETEANSGTNLAKIATNLQAAQLRKWQEDGKTVEDVLKLMELHTIEGNPLQNPILAQLFAFAKLKHKNDIKATEAMLTAFRELHKDDAAWAKLLFAETETISEKPFADVAANLQTAQIRKWQEDGKTEGKLFTLLQLNMKGDQLFQNSLFLKWARLVYKKHRKDKNAAAEEILSTLRDNYGEEAELEDVLHAGTKIIAMKDLAFDLESKLIERWLDTKKSVDDVFQYLRLESFGEALFNEPRFLVWLDFVGTHADEKFDTDMNMNVNARNNFLTVLIKMFVEGKLPWKVSTTDVNMAVNLMIQDKEDLVILDVYKAVLDTLRFHYNDDRKVRDILTMGLSSNNKNAKDVAEGGLELLDKEESKNSEHDIRTSELDQ